MLTQRLQRAWVWRLIALACALPACIPLDFYRITEATIVCGRPRPSPVRGFSPVNHMLGQTAMLTVGPHVAPATVVARHLADEYLPQWTTANYEQLHGIIWDVFARLDQNASAVAAWRYFTTSVCPIQSPVRMTVAYACLHGLGHGVLLRELSRRSLLRYSSCEDLSGACVDVPSQALAAAELVCEAAPNREMAYGCVSGVHHGYFLMRSSPAAARGRVGDWAHPCERSRFPKSCFEHVIMFNRPSRQSACVDDAQFRALVSKNESLFDLCRATPTRPSLVRGCVSALAATWYPLFAAALVAPEGSRLEACADANTASTARGNLQYCAFLLPRLTRESLAGAAAGGTLGAWCSSLVPRAEWSGEEGQLLLLSCVGGVLDVKQLFDPAAAMLDCAVLAGELRPLPSLVRRLLALCESRARYTERAVQSWDEVNLFDTELLAM